MFAATRWRWLSYLGRELQMPAAFSAVQRGEGTVDDSARKLLGWTSSVGFGSGPLPGRETRFAVMGDLGAEHP